MTPKAVKLRIFAVNYIFAELTLVILVMWSASFFIFCIFNNRVSTSVRFTAFYASHNIISLKYFILLSFGQRRTCLVIITLSNVVISFDLTMSHAMVNCDNCHCTVRGRFDSVVFCLLMHLISFTQYSLLLISRRSTRKICEFHGPEYPRIK